MPSIFSKNCILTGLINHYCLICSKHFENEEETLAHTLEPLHKQNLNSNGYLDKYKEDLIRKFQGLYFCELCNMTFPTATKVGLHVAEGTHITKKSEIIQVVRKNNDIVAFGRFVISEDAWNGFIDGTCFVCHAEFDDKAAHKTSKSHILKLIKSEVTLGDGAIYRKIDDKLYQCITCNTIISETELFDHFIATEHLKALTNYKAFNIETINEDKIKLLENEKNMKPDNENKNKNQDETVKNQVLAEKPQDKIDKTQKKINKNKNEKAITQDKTEKKKDKMDKNQDEKDRNQDDADKNQVEAGKPQDKQDIDQDNNNTVDKAQEKAEKTQHKINETEEKIYINKDEKDIIQDKTEKMQDEIDKKQDQTKKNQDRAENDKDAVNNARKDNANPTRKAVDKKKRFVDLDQVYCKSLGAKDYVAGMTNEKWCILCERVLDVSADEHIRSKHHQTLLTMHKERLENNNSQYGARNGDKANLLEFVDKYQKCNVNIDLINETAFCKQCWTNIEFDSDAIDKHIEDHEKKVNKKSKGKQPLLSGMKSDGRDKTTLFTKPVSIADSRKGSSLTETWSVANLEEFAKQHGLKYNRADKSFYCNACSRRLLTTREDLEKHVGSEGHKRNISNQSFRKQIAGKTVQKVPILEYIENFKIIETLGDSTDMVINGNYCLDAYGFCLLAKKGYLITCLVCEIDLAPEYVGSHIISTKSHMDAVAKCLIVTSLENEFVREIKLNTYHCGFCNILEHDWEDILDHLTTQEHKRCKIRAQVTLQKYAADRGRSFVCAAYAELVLQDLMSKFGFKQQLFH